MNMERAQMRVKLANLKQRKLILTGQIEEICTTIRANLNTNLTPIADLNVAETAGQMDALVVGWGELQATLADIARIEGELE